MPLLFAKNLKLVKKLINDLTIFNCSIFNTLKMGV